MSLKETIISFLFGNKTEEAALPQEGTEQGAPGQTVPEEAPPPNPAVLELPSDHPLHQLYTLRRHETGTSLPSPHLSLDEEDELPLDLVQREKKRLESSLRTVCSSRLKAAKGGGSGRRSKKKEEEEETPFGLDALPWFFLSADKLYAWVLIFPPAGQGAELSREILYQGMFGQGILYGIDERLADRLSHDENRYFHLFRIARGKPAFDGKNGNIIDYFPRVVERVLEIDEYDQVDYAALNLIHNVGQGEEICRLILPTEGNPGRTVLDQEIPAKSGKTVPLPKGRNTEIGEDGVTLVATIAGHVEFSGRAFQVRPVMDVPGDVDFSVGNINFLGDVNIKGDVRTGFTVRAMGNVHVDGMVEAGSTVEAGGDLVVVKGILGDGTTSIRSQRCIFSKYIENVTIYARENLQTDCILNGNIYCDGEVQVRSGRGSIMGGRVWAAQKISATSIGSRSECRTVIALGGTPCTNFERDLLQQELEELEIEQEKLECQADSPIKASLLGKNRMKLSVAELKLKQLDSDLETKKVPQQKEKNSGRLECGVAYPSTELIFGEETLRLRHEYRQCVARLINGEIVVI